MDDTNAPAEQLVTSDGAASAERKQDYVTLADEDETQTDGDDEGVEAEDDDSGQGEDAEQSTEADDGKPKRRPGSARWRERARNAERELAELRAQRQQVEASADAGDDLKEPQEQDFPDWLSYQRALHKYDARVAHREERARERQEEDSRRVQREQGERAARFRDNVGKFRDRIPDFDRVMAAGRVVPNSTLIPLIQDSPKSALLAYYFAKNPDKTADLNAMPPDRAAQELGRIEARIRIPTGKTATSARPARQTPRGGSAPPQRDPTKMSMEDFVRWREGK